MTTTQQPTAEQVPAADLNPGDRIAAGFLPDGDAADIEYVRPYEAHGDRWVLVVHRFDDGVYDSWAFLADKPIPLQRRADLFEGRTTAVLQPKPDTLGVALGRAAQGR